MRRTLEEQVAEVEAGLTSLAEDAVKMVAINATANATAATPVDTGNARRNWIPAIGARVERPDESGSGAAQAAGQAALSSYRLEKGRVYVSNPTPYIERLDAGHSAQAPAGFVRQAIEQAVDETQRAIQAAANRPRRSRGRR